MLLKFIKVINFDFVKNSKFQKIYQFEFFINVNKMSNPHNKQY